MPNKNIFFILLVVIFLTIVFFLANQKITWISDVQVKNFPAGGIKFVKIAGKTLKVELALTPEARELGLSGRKELKENEGMLFVFERAGKYPFWMKEMNFPIDIIWLQEDLRVVYIKKNALPESYLPASEAGPETFTPSGDAKYVLEVVSSFSEKNNLREGDKAEFLSS